MLRLRMGQRRVRLVLTKMTTKEAIQKEIDQAPEPVLEETLAYIRLLKAMRERRISDTALASEASLSKDWLRPEEEAAWRNL